MPSSMTGFGRSESLLNWGRLIVEVQSVNRKYLEVQVFLPKELSRLENDIRKLVSEKVLRGQISVRLQVVSSKESLSQFLPDVELLKNFQLKWLEIAKELGFSEKEVSLEFLMDHLPSSPKQEIFSETDVERLKLCLIDALDQLASMKKKEGRALEKDVLQRLKTIQDKVELISESSFDFVDRTRQKLQEKMRLLFPADASIDERVVKEIAFYAEKVDIAEELTRLRSHFVMFDHCFKEKGAQGRKMDFLVQEMGREVNTIGSKSSETKISHLVVEIKSELEKIREQIQNIE